MTVKPTTVATGRPVGAGSSCPGVPTTWPPAQIGPLTPSRCPGSTTLLGRNLLIGQRLATSAWSPQAATALSAAVPRVHTEAPGDEILYQVRLGPRGWELANLANGRTSPMSSRRFDGTNAADIDQRGRGLRGRFAHVVSLPIALADGRPRRIPAASVQLRHGNALTERHHLVTNGRGYYVLLDERVYAPRAINLEPGLTVTLFAAGDEASNPDLATIEEVMRFFADTFPEATRSLDPPTLVTLLNRDERFDDIDPSWVSGFHTRDLVVLTSHDGTGTHKHRLHELGGLYKIDNRYGQSLTWMIAYDQTDKQAPPLQRGAQRLDELRRQQSYLVRAGRQGGFEHSVDWYMQDVNGRGGFALFGWGAGLLWKDINRQLERDGAPSLYELIRIFHRRGDALPGRGLEQLISAYEEAFGVDHRFRERVEQRFRNQSLDDLLWEVRREMRLERPQGTAHQPRNDRRQAV